MARVYLPPKKWLLGVCNVQRIVACRTHRHTLLSLSASFSQDAPSIGLQMRLQKLQHGVIVASPVAVDFKLS